MSVLLLLVLLASPSWRAESFEVVETRTFRESIPLEGWRGLTVDNVFGAITVAGDGGSDIRMVVSERIEAEDREQLQRARDEASLEISRRGDRIVICADGPFRDPDDCTEWAQGLHRGRDRYRVVYEIELKVPRSIDLEVGTIEGDLTVSDVRGRLDVHGVQGAVEIQGAAGPVTAGTVNSGVHVVFVENPREDSSFGTVNGEIDVVFRPDLSADLFFETMNGEILTDFEYRKLSPVTRRSESSRAGITYRLEVDSGIRIGRGGPQLRFNNINGDITIHRN
ncbi:MAG: hypothetical protein ACREAA_16120 [Candidatus Polarisedimenticolia bacterium]